MLAIAFFKRRYLHYFHWKQNNRENEKRYQLCVTETEITKKINQKWLFFIFFQSHYELGEYWIKEKKLMKE